MCLCAFRSRVISALPRLKTMDFSAVTRQERVMAKIWSQSHRRSRETLQWPLTRLRRGLLKPASPKCTAVFNQLLENLMYCVCISEVKPATYLFCCYLLWLTVYYWMVQRNPLQMIKDYIKTLYCWSFKWQGGSFPEPSRHSGRDIL